MVRDRTSEFMATIKSMAGRPQFLASQANGMPMELRSRKGANNSNTGDLKNSPLLNPQSSQYTQFGRFMGGSRSIARDLYLTFQKLEKINMLAKKKTIFDDEESSKELNELVYIVKQDITSLNQQIEQLRQQQLESMKMHNSGGSNVRSHTKNVVITLQQQLASISSSFKSTLELRTKNMKKQRQRREQFTTTASINTPLMGQNTQRLPVQSNTTLPHSRSTSALTTVINFDDDNQTETGGDQPIRGHRHNNSATIQTQALLQFEDSGTQYLEERANTMQSIESTIVELGTIFNQLTTMVHQQEEMITRIDANVTDTMLNVEAAHQSLIQYLQSVTSNRWLMIKSLSVYNSGAE
ncbi:Syntaxin-5 [Blomia tropicalis]|nr:Syntaxin-5 [Blomia tropicalis]